MARLPGILSVALLVAHLMVGCCCACHVHACESDRDFSAIHGTATLDVGCPRCICEHSHHGSLECRGHKCSFISPRRPVGGSFNLKLPASFAVLTDAGFPRMAIGLREQSRTTGYLLLPVRLHLANQILLI